VGKTDDYKIVASTDFFTSPFLDPYLAGRVAALHAASDIVASGASPKHALSNVVVPEGASGPQQSTLCELLAGAKREFDAMGAAIVGGHTIEGPRLEIGFTVIGNAVGDDLLQKQNLKEGDGLYMTKPLGIGVLLAAHMRGRCNAEHYSQLVQAMLERQHAYAALAINSGVTAGTDITGFGLAGHLLEMLEASNIAATLHLDDIPTLAGATDAIAAGIQSSLAPSNRLAVAKVDASSAVRHNPCFDLLFDPQTCGGLLLGVAERNADQINAAVVDAGLRPLMKIGTVDELTDGNRPLLVV
jgi:selenide,water dikinase